MDPTVEQSVIFREILGKSSTFSHRTVELILKKIDVHVLEMEDVLFHLDSSVMMPERPSGKSSTDGASGPQTGIKELQDRITGVKALALVFKQVEFDPDKRILVAGHTDTSGQAKYNFELSDLRAKNILYLLTGEREDWATVSHNRHRIEDYQQILMYVFKSRKWPCNPVKVDNNWGDDTEKATNNFIQYYNSEFADKHARARIPGTASTAVRNDARKRWTREMLEAVYDIYSEDIANTLSVSADDLESLRHGLNFVSDEKRFVGCGESFPIQSAEKDNYRSQQNRRVEILFFDKDEVPVLNCPAQIEKVHKASECPIYHPFHFVPLYIDPADLYAVVYHIGFKYFNRVTNKWMDVPDGLQIQAFENGTKELKTEAKWKNGVYSLKVQYETPLNDSARKTVHFEFKADQTWLYTKDKSATPVFKKETSDNIKVLPFTERFKYYDLPPHWSSQNYWTRYDGNMGTGNRFEKVVKDDKKLKPFGGAITTPDKPLLFSLDDVVLVDATGKQAIQDKDGSDNPVALSENSRVCILFLDPDDKFKVKVHKAKADGAYHSDVAFKENLISDLHGASCAVVFCSDFYHISKRRTENVAGFDFSKDHILGARAARINDADVSGSKAIIGSTGSADVTSDYVAKDCGNFDLYYLHGCGLSDKKIVSALVLYWSGRFKVDAGNGGTATDRVHYETKGFQNAMERHAAKDYQVEKVNGSEEILIRPFSLFEAKQDISVAAGGTIQRGGKHKCLVTLVSDAQGSWMAINTAQFRTSGYADESKPFGSSPGDPDDPLNTVADYDGSTTKRLTVAHELGHASGLDDEYVSSVSGFSPVPKFTQYYPGMPYSIDNLALMTGNHATRMRHMWGRVNWLNDFGKAGKALHPFLKGTEFGVIA